MKNSFNKMAKFLSKKFANRFPKEFRENFRRKITVTKIQQNEKEFIINYEIDPYINVRIFSDYKAYLKSEKNFHKLECIFSKRHIQVKVPRNFLKVYPTGFNIELYSNNVRMNVKRQRKNEDILTRFIYDGTLFKISTTKVIRYVPVLENLKFVNKIIQISQIKFNQDKISISLNNNIKEEVSNIYAFYPHKFTEIYDVNIVDNDLIINNLDQFTMGEFKIYIEINSKLYLLGNDLNKSLGFNTEFYHFDIQNKNGSLSFVLTEHIMFLQKLVFEQKTPENLLIKIRDFNNINVEDGELLLLNTLSNEIDTVSCIDTNTFIIPMEKLIENFSRKKISLKTFDKVFQFDLTETEIINNNDKKYNNKGEILDTKFYRRKDNYLGFRIKRPKIKRLITEIKDLEIKGFIKGTKNFSNLTPCLMLMDRESEEKLFYELETDFHISLDPLNILNIMSKEKTIIDFYVAFLDEDKNIIRQTKIQYKESNYKKDNYYGHRTVIDKENNEVHLLITTTPFHNLKIETFTVPSGLNTEIYKRDKNIWLIGERRNTAQENGIALFKYLINHTDEEAYYVIEEDSKDYENIKHLPNILEFGSKEHFEVALKAGVLLCTHDFENILPYKPAKGFYDYEQTFKVFLQHGVLGRKPAEYHKFYYEDSFNIFIVSSEPEKTNIVMDIMGYETDEVAVTGLARFDDLPFNNETKDILLMPTWRDWINNDEAFLNSEYYFKYQSLLTNERLNELLEKNNIRLNFYPHYRAQDFFNAEILKTGKNIRFIELGEEKVQDLLINHSLLITDYSSVSFDFTLMDKPVLYYHFDEYKFFRKGILRPIEETFLGDIADSEEQLIDFIQESIQNNFQNTVKDVEGILKYRDHNNSKRIHQVVKEALEK